MSRKIWVVHGGARTPVATRTKDGAIALAIEQTDRDRTGDVVIHDDDFSFGRHLHNGPDRQSAMVHIVEVEILEI